MIRQLVLIGCAAYLACCGIAAAVEFTYPKGARISSLSDWPKGLHKCASAKSRIYGRSFMTTDDHYYSGDVTEFNRFVEEYSKVGLNSHDVVLLPGEGQIEVVVEKGQGKTKVPYDWKLHIRPGGGNQLNGGAVYDATISVYLERQIKRDEMKIPSNVQVDDQTRRRAQSKSVRDDSPDHP